VPRKSEKGYPESLGGEIIDVYTTSEWSTPTDRNHLGCLVEAVGIEQVSIHPVSPILQGFSRTDGAGLSVEKRYESGLSDNLGTRVPKLREPDELLEHARRIWGTLRVV